LFIWYKLLLLLLLIIGAVAVAARGEFGANMDTRIDSVLQPYSTLPHWFVNGTEPVGGLVGDGQLCCAVPCC
jgi:hypothetical protein